MKSYSRLVLLFILLMIYNQTSAQKTLGESNSNFTYIPFDPLPVYTLPGNSCKPCKKCNECDSIPFKTLQNSFPDLTVRLSIEKITDGKSIGFGNYFTAKKKGETYKVILDYIHADVSRIPFLLKSTKEQSTKDGKKIEKTVYKILPVARFVDKKNNPINSPATEHDIKNNKVKSDSAKSKTIINPSEIKISYTAIDNGKIPDGKIVTVPVYVGIGLRITANVTTIDRKAKLSGLSIIGGEVAKGKLKGNLTVQTLGISGEKILLPLPSEINQTTIQNALVAIGSLRSLIYDESTQITPRVVGIYKPFEGGEQVINDIISELARDRVVWHRPCNTHATYKGNKAN